MLNVETTSFRPSVCHWYGFKDQTVFRICTKFDIGFICEQLYSMDEFRENRLGDSYT
jgi:hypothetical protein